MTVSLCRLFLLVVGVAGPLASALFDAPMHRHLLLPALQLLERHAPRPVQYPRVMRFMIDRAWARQLYNVLFASSMLALWWYLGTPAGAAWFTASVHPH